MTASTDVNLDKDDDLNNRKANEQSNDKTDKQSDDKADKQSDTGSQQNKINEEFNEIAADFLDACVEVQDKLGECAKEVGNGLIKAHGKLLERTKSLRDSFRSK